MSGSHKSLRLNVSNFFMLTETISDTTVLDDTVNSETKSELSFNTGSLTFESIRV